SSTSTPCWPRTPCRSTGSSDGTAACGSATGSEETACRPRSNCCAGSDARASARAAPLDLLTRFRRRGLRLALGGVERAFGPRVFGGEHGAAGDGYEESGAGPDQHRDTAEGEHESCGGT